MAYNKEHVITTLSILFIFIAVALSGYAYSRISRFSIPISPVLSSFTTFLPIIAGVLLKASYALTRAQERHRRVPRNSTPRPPFVVIANTLIFIYSSVVITLLGTHAAPPSGLDCSLQNRWKDMFSRKDSAGIRAIQDGLNCCGLVNSHDRAWPFPDKSHDIHACETAFGRDTGCLGRWRGEEQRMAGLLMVVVGIVVILQLVIIATPTNRSSWLHHVVPESISNLLADDEHGQTTLNGNGSSRAIDYQPSSDRYRDNAVAEVTDTDSENERPSQAQRGIEAGQRAARRLTHAVTAGDVGHSEQRHGEQQHDEPTDNAWGRVEH